MSSTASLHASLNSPCRDRSAFADVATIDFADSLAPDEIVERARKLAAKCRAVALVGRRSPHLDRRGRGDEGERTAVFSLLSDFAAGIREGYVGLDNRKVGRTAAWMISKAARRPARSPCFVGSHRFHGHELREIGFRSFFREQARNSPCLKRWSTWKHQITHDTIIELLGRHPDPRRPLCSPRRQWRVRSRRSGRRGGRDARGHLQRDHSGIAFRPGDNILTMVISTPLAALCRNWSTSWHMPSRRAPRMRGPDLPAVRHLSAREYIGVSIFEIG